MGDRVSVDADFSGDVGNPVDADPHSVSVERQIPVWYVGCAGPELFDDDDWLDVVIPRPRKNLADNGSGLQRVQSSVTSFGDTAVWMT